MTEVERALEEWLASNPTATVAEAFVAGFEVARRPRVRPVKVPREAHQRILEEHQAGRTYASIASEYGVSPSRVRAICRDEERRQRQA